MVQDVVMLNSQLVALGGRPGVETRMLIQERLWAIIADLDRRFLLQLDNHCLDLNVENGRLRIHFWTGRGSPPELETNIYIRDSFLVERHVTDLRTGQTSIL